MAYSIDYTRFDGVGNYLVGLEKEKPKPAAEFSRTKILLAAIAVSAACVLCFTPGLPTNVFGDNHPGDPHPDDPVDPDEETNFAVSGNHFRDAQSTLGNVSLEDGWSGNSGTCHGDRHIGFKNLIEQVADTSQGVDTTVRTQAKQVNAGKETLDTTVTGLQLALPVAESLYFSGPAGPALSHHYQIAVANSAVESSTDTTKNMHENSKMHARRLTALIQQYDETLRSLPSTNRTAPR